MGDTVAGLLLSGGGSSGSYREHGPRQLGDVLDIGALLVKVALLDPETPPSACCLIQTRWLGTHGHHHVRFGIAVDRKSIPSCRYTYLEAASKEQGRQTLTGDGVIVNDKDCKAREHEKKRTLRQVRVPAQRLRVMTQDVRARSRASGKGFS